MVLGVDVGGTKVAVAAVDGVTATHTREHPTVTVSTDALLDGVEHVVRDVIADAGQPDAIGVGVPSQIDFSTGTVETSVNIPLDRDPAARGAGDAASACPCSWTTTPTAPPSPRRTSSVRAIL